MAKKVKMSIKDMDAKEQLYGSRLTKGRAARIIMGYEIGVIVFTYILYGPNNLLWMAGWMAVAALYIVRRLLPRKVESDYQRRGENQRNRFVNYVTQSMTTTNANITNALKDASKKLDGEFRLELESLIAVMMSSQSFDETHKAFKKIQHKYEHDIYFVLFMEQVETVYHESVYHIETFNTFKDSHNTVLMKEKEFIQKKAQIQKNMVTMLGISCFTNAVCLMASGYDKYLKVYANSIGGIVVSTIYMVALALIVNGFYKRFYDDDVLHF